jgi:hypothetical protein
MPYFGLVFSLVFTGSAALVQVDDSTRVEKSFGAPLPTPLGSSVSLMPMLPRPGTREVWQYYGVDSRGRWVPRVILSPFGSYYYYNGAPYPYTPQPNTVLPYVVD